MIQLLDSPLQMALPLNEVRAYLKILQPAEDRLLTHLVKTAAALVAKRHGHYALTQRVRVTAPLIHDVTRGLRRYARLFYHYPFITLSLYPIQSVEQVEVLRRDGKRRVIDPRFWSLSHTRGPHRLTIKVMDGASVQVDLTVGYGGEPEAIPITLRQQILFQVGKLYEKRDDLLVEDALFPRQLSLLGGEWGGKWGNDL